MEAPRVRDLNFVFYWGLTISKNYAILFIIKKRSVRVVGNKYFDGIFFKFRSLIVVTIFTEVGNPTFHYNLVVLFKKSLIRVHASSLSTQVNIYYARDHLKESVNT